MRCVPILFAGLLAVSRVLAEPTIEAPLDVRKTLEARFTEPPRAIQDGRQVKITFALSAPTDVEVAIVDARGNVVRHLAAGLLGPNAPKPLEKGTLRQTLFWNGCDDAGRSVAVGGCKVRVRSGSQAKLEKYLGREPLTFVGSIEAITVGRDGELYVLNGEGAKFGRAELLVLDKNGKYLRTIMPYPANTPKERTESVGHLTVDGRRTPILFSGHSFSVYPLVCGIRGQTMAVHPKGYLIAASSTGTAREHGPPRHLIAFHPHGGAPEGVPFVGPKILEARGFMGGGGEREAVGLDRLAVSPDGHYIYFSHHFATRRFETKIWKHGIYRLKWSDEKLGELWLGKDKPGAGENEFNDPQGIAVDREGRLYVCDRGNHRIKIYAADGKLLGKFGVETPEQISVDAATSRIFVLSRIAEKRAPTGKLSAFSPWKEGKCHKLAELEVPGLKLMALDSPTRLWVTIRTPSQRLVPVAFDGSRFALGQPIINTGGLVGPSFLAADPARDRVIVKEHLVIRNQRPFRAISLSSGKMTHLNLSGSDITLDSLGNIYCTDGYENTHLARYSPDGKPLPFAATGSNKIPVKFRSYGPDMGLRGHRVAPNGDIYVIRSVNHAVGASLDQYGPDGKLKKAGLVAGVGGGDSGLGVDADGNLYVGMNIRPVERPFPVEFAGQVPVSNWTWWRKKVEKAPWGYIYMNPYLFHMGSVFKFGPEGGVVYGQQKVSRQGAPMTSPGTELEKSPANVTTYKSAYLERTVKVTGAQWRYGGVGNIPTSLDGPSPDPGCRCMPSHLDADLWGRVFAPSATLFSVEMLDSAGNRIARIGSYGNGDSIGPEIAFAGPVACDFAEADGKLYVSDMANRRVVVVRFDWAASAETSIP